MPIDPSLSLNIKTFEPPNPLNQLAQVSQIQAAQRQGELSQMQLDELKNDRLEMQKFQQELAAKGGNIDLNAYADMLLKSPKHMQMGLELKQKLVDQQKYDAYLRSKGVLPASPMPVAAPAAAPNMLGAEEAVSPPANALAPAPAPATNALVAPPVKPVVQPVAQQVVRPADTEESILSDIRALSSSNDPRAKAEVDVLKNKLANLQKGSNLIREYEYAVAHGYRGSLPDFKVLSAPKTTVSVTNSPTGKSLAAPVGTRAEASLAKAEGAVGMMENANMVREALNTGNVIAGPLAGARTKFAQVLQMAGADQKAALEATRNTIQGLAAMTLESRAELKGQGQVTGDEQKLLERARSGSIEDMTLPELQQIVNVSQRLAKRLWTGHQTLLNTMKTDPAAADVLRYYQPTGALPTEVGEGKPKAEVDKRKAGLAKIFGG